MQSQSLKKRRDNPRFYIILPHSVMVAKPNYSSFVGNFLFRDLNLPDMTLSSIEIGRRCYEFKTQYIDKTKEKKEKYNFT